MRKQALLAVWFTITISFLGGYVGVAGAGINSAVFSTTQDSTIKQDKRDNNFGANAGLNVQSFLKPGPNRPENQRALVQFDISTLPSGATIEAADLRLWLSGPPAVSRSHNVYRLQNSWNQGTFVAGKNSAAVNGVTWYERQYGDNLWTGAGPWDWSSQGGDYLGTPTAMASTPAIPGWMVWNVIGDIEAFYEGSAANHGWLIRDEAEDSNQSMTGSYASLEADNPAQAPSLVVTYLKTGASLSTDTVPIAWASSTEVRFTNTAGSGGDEVRQVSFTIPAGWSRIPTGAGGYSVIASAGKSWSVTGLPAGPTGPQTVTVSAAAGADDLAPGESVDIIFALEGPWLLGNTIWAFTTTGAAGGTHPPPEWTVATTAGSGTLNFQYSGEQALDGVGLTGYDTTATGGLGTLTVRDERGTGSGWSLFVSASDFFNEADSSRTIPAAGLSVPIEPPVTVLGGSGPPVSGSGSLAGAGLALLTAASGSGAGHFEITPQLELIVPAATPAGTYAATITETLIGGL